MKKLVFLLFVFIFSLTVSLFLINTPTMFSQVTTPPQSKVNVIIDAGHGGFDGGAQTDDGVPEKGINLEIALYLRNYLEFFGFNVFLTRETDESTESPGLSTVREKKRSDIHNRMSLMENTENAIFVSIHQNHFSSSKYKGAQVFYSPQFSEESAFLAEKIQESIIYNLQPDNTRQIKQSPTSVYLIYNAVKPAVLVECGFLSNIEDAENLKTPLYQQKTAFAIAIGILNFYESQ